MLAAAAAFGGGLAGPAWSQAREYPSRAIRMLVGFAAGGTPDAIARNLAEGMARHLGQTITVDNRAGANGIIAAEALVTSPADGYTLLLTTPSLVINTSVYRKLPYDINKDFAAVTNVALGDGYLLIANPATGVKTVADLVALGKKRKGLTFSSPGIGNTLHLAAQIFCDGAGIEMTHVPYKGAAPALNAVISGEVQAMMIPPTVAVPQARAGKINVLAFTGAQRWPFMKDVPTIGDSVRGLVVNSGWHGLFAPAGTPADAIARINGAARKAMAEPRMRDFLVEGGYQPDPQSPDEFSAFLKSERQRYAQVVKSAHIEPE
jgi:tripartite-type tricarboxylate transporter receptor subunit TctC